METKFKIIEPPDYILAVSDEEIKEGDYIYTETCLPNRPDTHISKCIDVKRFYELGCPNEWKKIIAYQPKSNTSELDLPLLPEMVVEDTVEKLINEQINDFKHDLVESTSTYYKMNCEGAILALNRLKKSYKSATKVYTEEDLKMMFAYAHQIGMNTLLQIQSPHLLEKQDNYKLRDNFIQSLKQPKTPKWFVAETKSIYNKEAHEIEEGKMELKTTTINGKTYLVGTYE